MRRGFILTHRSRSVHNTSRFHRLRISLFFSYTRSSFPYLRVAGSYKSGRICAQLPFSVPQFHLRRSLYSSLPITSDVHSVSFQLALFSLHRSSFTYLRVEVKARPDLRSATTFRSTIPSSPISLRLNFIILLSTSHLALFLVDSLCHYGILSSSLPSVQQRSLVFLCFRKLSRAS